MRGRLLGVAFALAVPACGSVFTAGPGDAGPGGEAGLGVDASQAEAGAPDAPADVANEPEAGMGDASEGGTVGADAASCTRTCPSNFTCDLGKCVDRLRSHFNVISTMGNRSGNWQYGSFTPLAGTNFAPYTVFASSSGVYFWGLTTSPEPSAFFNAALFKSAMFDGITVPPSSVGFFASDKLGSGVMWTPPAAGSYDVVAVFTGLGSDPSTTSAVSVFEFKSSITQPPFILASYSINQNGIGNNTATYSTTGDAGPAPLSLTPSTPLAFVVESIPGADVPQTGTGVEITITAE